MLVVFFPCFHPLASHPLLPTPLCIQAHAKGLKDRGEEAERRGAPEDRDHKVAADAAQRSKREKAIRAGSDQEQLLNQTEKNLKFGIFSLTLQYFRSMTLVRRQYDVMSGKKAAAGLEGKKINRHVSEERVRMDEEQNMLDARLKRSNQAEQKALVGMSRRQTRVAKERGQQRENLRILTRTRLVQRASAIKLQALYRGHIGRLAAMKWAVKKAEIDAMRALQHAAAVSGWIGGGLVDWLALLRCSCALFVLVLMCSSLRTGGHRTRVAWCHGAAGSGRTTH